MTNDYEGSFNIQIPKPSAYMGNYWEFTITHFECVGDDGIIAYPFSADEKHNNYIKRIKSNSEAILNPGAFPYMRTIIANWKAITYGCKNLQAVYPSITKKMKELGLSREDLKWGPEIGVYNLREGDEGFQKMIQFIKLFDFMKEYTTNITIRGDIPCAKMFGQGLVIAHNYLRISDHLKGSLTVYDSSKEHDSMINQQDQPFIVVSNAIMKAFKYKKKQRVIVQNTDNNMSIEAMVINELKDTYALSERRSLFICIPPKLRKKLGMGKGEVRDERPFSKVYGTVRLMKNDRQFKFKRR